MILKIFLEEILSQKPPLSYPHESEKLEVQTLPIMISSKKLVMGI
jgi:hypothetical protein